MQTKESQFIAIDLKSFYASVECVERGMDPLDTCLVVADASRTNKTICLAVSAALKSFKTGGRPRLFELEQKIRMANRERHGRRKSISLKELTEKPQLKIDYIVAPPRMSRYLEYSHTIEEIYLRYISKEDLYVYSVDEVFIDATPYLQLYGISAVELARKIVRDISRFTGITATAGVGTNMYLCKIAMDIMAKKMPPDENGVRVAELNEMTYREQLWEHQPLTDFWRLGAGTARRLAQFGMFTMGDIARCSIDNEPLLYRQFGVNAEFLIDHAWGYEPVTMAEVKAYRPATHSLSSGQVLTEAYSAAKARIVALEMIDSLSLKLIDHQLLTDQITLTISYDHENILNPEIRARYTGKIKADHYGRPVPVHSHGTTNFRRPTSAGSELAGAIGELFDRIVNPLLLIRRLTIGAHRLTSEADTPPIQLEFFVDYDELTSRTERERRRQETILTIKKQFGKNAILTGLNYAEGATQRQRNSQIGGHKA
ncbi:MAG: DNA methylase [Muribaculaceae bacterium]|nr:DNA methylase [Muribaculaceae bacterium]